MPQKLLDAIEKRLAAESPYKKKIWLDALPLAVQSEFEEVRKRFKDGKYPNTRAHIAKALSEAAAEHLPNAPSQCAVERWLVK
jgi:hypothetical protein